MRKLIYDLIEPCKNINSLQINMFYLSDISNFRTSLTRLVKFSGWSRLTLSTRIPAKATQGEINIEGCGAYCPISGLSGSNCTANDKVTSKGVATK